MNKCYRWIDQDKFDNGERKGWTAVKEGEEQYQPPRPGLILCWNAREECEKVKQEYHRIAEEAKKKAARWFV